MKLIVAADDYGLTPGVSEAIEELLSVGAISNTSVMVAAEGSLARVRSQRELLKGRAGVHLQLTSGNPVSDPVDVPSLVDDSGRFLKDAGATTRQPNEIELEWTNQIEALQVALGERPAYMDSHKYVGDYAWAAEVFGALASRYNMPVRAHSSPHLATEARVRLAGSKILIDDWTCSGESYLCLVDRLRELAGSDPTSVVELVSHPGHCDDELVRLSSFNKCRESDFSTLLALANFETTEVQPEWTRTSYSEISHTRP